MAMILKVREVKWIDNGEGEDKYPIMKTVKVVIVDDDYDYAAQCDDTISMVHISYVVDDVKIEDWREKKEE